MSPEKNERIEKLRVLLRERAARLRAEREARAVPMPPPRYDEVWERGVEMLDRLARGEEIDDARDL